MAIDLGKDCTVTWATGAMAGVRSVVASETTREIEVRPRASRNIFTYTVGYSVEVQIETIDSADASAAITAAESGAKVVVAGTGFSFDAVVTSVTSNQPLNDVVSYTITLQRTGSNYR